ncbi:MAG TPA: helix-hairpin-helix domain-containing protein [Methylophilaceae bacterium]|jgi:predicted flap endonuclease-1-like 5' DNA nuclease
MTWFTCCWFQFFLGVLVGWILAWWFSRSCDDCSGGDTSAPSHSHAASHAPQPLTSAPAANHPVAPAPAPAPKTVSRADMVAAAGLAGISFKGVKNDLQIIEGIGPKIAGLMSEDGIRTFEDLASASLDKLNAILEKAGPRFRLANPSTWAQQARLAADGQWAQLKALQDSLDGGVVK